MPDFLTVSEAARQLRLQLGVDINPRNISTLLYERALRDDLCPIVGGRRLIPSEYLGQIATALRRRRMIPPLTCEPGCIDRSEEGLA